MKVLFTTSPLEDYLGDGVLHGMRTLLGADCVDFALDEITARGGNEFWRTVFFQSPGGFRFK
ncbi:MAG: hypothetical protein NXI32_18110 [bacterium]|nr:hypothetical protein [bacterium]